MGGSIGLSRTNLSRERKSYIDDDDYEEDDHEHYEDDEDDEDEGGDKTPKMWPTFFLHRPKYI